MCSCVYSDVAIRTEVQRALNKIIKEAAVVADLSGVKEKTRSALLQSCFKTTDTIRNAIAKHTDGVCVKFLVIEFLSSHSTALSWIYNVSAAKMFLHLSTGAFFWEYNPQFLQNCLPRLWLL